MLDRYLSSDYFRRSKASGKNQLKWLTFSSLWLYVEEKQTCFVDSSHRDDIKCCTGKEKRQQNLLSLHNAKIKGRVQGIDRYLSSDYFRRSKASGKNQLKWLTFSSLWLYVEEKQTCFVDSSHRDDIKCCTGKEKRQQNLLSLHNAKIKGRVQSIKTLF